MNWSWGFLIIGLSLMGSILTVGATRNLVRNPSAEEGKDTPADWIFWTRTNGKGVWDDKVAHSGRRSLRIDGSNSNDNWSQRNIPVQPGYLYRFRVWIRQERCYPWGPDVVITAQNAQGQALQSWQFRGRRGTRDWYPLEGYFVLPSNAVKLQIELRLLLLPGRVWFDDVSLEPVGIWQASAETKDPVADWQVKSRYLRSLSTEVVTPHWRWANRVHNAPIVFFAIDRIAQREILELAQRFNIPWRTTFLTVDTIPQYLTGEYYEHLSHEELRKALNEALREHFDVILLSGRIWEMLTDTERQAILARVRQGTALVQVGKPTKGENHSPLLEALGIALTSNEAIARPLTPQSGILAAYPNALPPIHIHIVKVTTGQVLAEARDEHGNVHPLLVSNNYGKGRTLFIAYRSEAPVHELFGAGLTPILPADRLRDVRFAYHEYLLASVAKWLLDVAHPDRWRLNGIQMRLAEERIEASAEIPAHQKPLQLRWRWRDKFSRLIAEQTESVSPSTNAKIVRCSLPVSKFPTGNIFVELIVESDDGCLDWAAASMSHEGRAQLRLLVGKDVIKHGQNLAGQVHINRNDQNLSAAVLKLMLVDNYGWQIEQRSHQVELRAPKVSLDISLPTHRLRSTGATLIAQLSTLDGQLLDEERVDVIVAGLHKWDDWRQVMWTVVGRSGYRSYLTDAIAERIRAIGVNTWLFNIVGEEWRLACKHDFGIVPIGIYGVWSTTHGFTEYATTQDLKWLERQPCLSSPEEMAKLERAVSNAVRMLAPYAPLAYCLSDENNLTYYNAPFDYCFSPHCLQRFREWLKQQYGELTNLNRAWDRQFSSWQEVVPDTFEQAKARGNFTAWADHRAFMDHVFVSVWHRAHIVATSIDPEARIALSGTPEPQAYGGYDWYPLMQTLGALFPYEQELQRHFADLPRVPWVAGYGSRGAHLSYNIWRSVFNGCQGIAAFWLPSLIEPDLTLTQSAKDLENITRPLRNGLGKLLLHAQPAKPEVAIYHSQPSIRVAFVLNMDEELTEERKGIALILNALGVPFAFVDHRQVEQGWLAQNMPKVLIMPMTLAMSDKEIQAVRNYVSKGGRILADVMPAVHDEHLRKRDVAPLADLFNLSASESLQWLKYADLREPLLPEKLLSAKGNVCIGRLPFCLHSLESHWRACPEIDQRCRAREEWLQRFLEMAQVRAIGRAHWEDDRSPVRDCLWARWDLGDEGHIIGVLRSPSAPSPRPMTVEFPKGKAIFDLLEVKWLQRERVTVTLPAGGIKLWAVLPAKPQAITVKVTDGSLKPGGSVTLDLRQKGAPTLTCYLVEFQDSSKKSLNGLGTNLLVRNGSGKVTLTLPYNLPLGTKVVITDILSGQTVSIRVNMERKNGRTQGR